MTQDETVTLERIKLVVEDMHTRLFGNGQPGFVDKTDLRLRDLEGSYARAKGFVGALWAAISFLGLGGLWHLLKGKG